MKFLKSNPQLVAKYLFAGLGVFVTVYAGTRVAVIKFERNLKTLVENPGSDIKSLSFEMELKDIRNSTRLFHDKIYTWEVLQEAREERQAAFRDEVRARFEIQEKNRKIDEAQREFLMKVLQEASRRL